MISRVVLLAASRIENRLCRQAGLLRDDVPVVDHDSAICNGYAHSPPKQTVRYPSTVKCTLCICCRPTSGLLAVNISCGQ